MRLDGGVGEGERGAAQHAPGGTVTSRYGRQRPPAEVLVPPQGGRQFLIMNDHLQPHQGEIRGDLPGFQP
jgi:hypothetical protein